MLNSNVIHLCLGVCDAEGEWITENKAKENFMKGKTEIEMYHGEGFFLKIYPKEVTRKIGLQEIPFSRVRQGNVLDHVFQRGCELEKSWVLEDVDSSDHDPEFADLNCGI